MIRDRRQLVLSSRLLSTGLASLLLASLLAACQPTEPPRHHRGGVELRKDSPRIEQRTGTAPQTGTVFRLLRIQDGDSFIVRRDDGKRETIRLSGIDAPERSQPFSAASRQHLNGLLADRDLEIRSVKKDRYGRTVAAVLVAIDGRPQDVGLLQLQSGLAWYFRHYESDVAAADRSRYDAAENAARQAGRGLWSVPAPQAPWDFRREKSGRK